MRLALLVLLTGCEQSASAIKNDAGDTAVQIGNATGTYWHTTDFKTDTKLQLQMTGAGMVLDADSGTMQTFSWDLLTPDAIEIFNCSTTCVLRGLTGISFSTADMFTSMVPPDTSTVTHWTLVQSSTFP